MFGICTVIDTWPCSADWDSQYFSLWENDRSPRQPRLQGHSQMFAPLFPSIWYPTHTLRRHPNTPMPTRSNFELFCTLLRVLQRFAAIHMLLDNFVYIPTSLDTFPDLDRHPQATSPQPSHISLTNNWYFWTDVYSLDNLVPRYCSYLPILSISFVVFLVYIISFTFDPVSLLSLFCCYFISFLGTIVSRHT